MNENTIVIPDADVPQDPEAALMIRRVLMINAEIYLCEKIAHAYPLLPDVIIVAYQDFEFRKLDFDFWETYLCGLLEAIAQVGLNGLPMTVVKAYERAVAARDYGLSQVAS